MTTAPQTGELSASGSPSGPSPAKLTAVTEIFLVGGERLSVLGDPKDVEATIIAAARGSIMQLAWVAEVVTGESIAINPEHVMMLRGAAK